MGNFIDPITDWGFKRIFGQEFSKELLRSFLNELLRGEHFITDLTFMDKEQLPETKDQRCSVYDIYCETDVGERIIVEMQNDYQEFFANRTIYYACRSLISQAESGRWDYRLAPVYVVSFMNFSFKETSHPKKLRTDVMLMDRDTGQVFSNNLRFIYLMLPQFQKTEDECETNFERWIYVLKNMSTLEVMPFAEQDAIFDKLAEIANKNALSWKERERYNESLKIMRDNYACYEGAKLLGRQEGRQEGRQQGLQEGRQEGRQEGLREGRNEERVLMVSSMHLNGMSAADIAKFTGIPLSEVEEIIR